MYEAYFGLKGKPFQLSPDAAFYYPSKEHQRALSFLQYGLNQADGFVVITGDVGTGKTTLLHTLLNELNETDMMVATVVTTQLGEEDLLHLAASYFGIRLPRDASKAIIVESLEKAFIQFAQQNRRVLLIIDEAQNLPPRSVEELRMLSNFQHRGRPLVQIFLLGQQQFRNTLLSADFEQLRQRVIATYHLNPLNEEETQTYVKHRLSRVGWKENPSFEAQAFAAIFKFTEGVPRRINNLCDRLLLFTFLEEQSVITAATVDKVSNEIGSEFWSGTTSEPIARQQSMPGGWHAQPGGEMPNPHQVGHTQGSLSSGTRLYEDSNLNKRLDSMERTIDGLTSSFNSVKFDELKEELTFIRLLLEDVVHTQRSNTDGATPTKKKHA
ncbi:MAG: XrtA-associated ATPase [Proteobacteria bacterium]|nr:XrtA-associated ATPase [Pseudomonadota bacterium]